MRPVAAVLMLLVLFCGPSRAQQLELLMLDQQGCEWCEAWESDIGGAYPLTEEGRIAPLRRVGIHDPLPDGVSLARRAHFTPTFVLLSDGTEVGRIDGYAGAEFFYPMLGRLLAAAGVSVTQP